MLVTVLVTMAVPTIVVEVEAVAKTVPAADAGKLEAQKPCIPDTPVIADAMLPRTPVQDWANPRLDRKRSNELYSSIFK